MAKLTPMMEQYFEIKKQYTHCLLFFRLGDFYEMFYDDALIASKELDIALTGRDCGQEKKAPMCGVPHHSADGYISRLVEKGFKVAICEQMENPKETKTIVKREVVRVITPGTVTDSNMLDEGKNSFIMCIYQGKSGTALAVADITTGEFQTTGVNEEIDLPENNSYLPGKNLIDEIAKWNPKEIVTNAFFKYNTEISKLFGIKPNLYDEWAFEPVIAEKKITSHLKILNINGLGFADKTPCICACGALLQYLSDTSRNTLTHITAIKYFSIDKYMVLDFSSRKNLELTETIRDKSKKGSLLWVLDRTKTAMGQRLLRRWVEQPLINIHDINRRLDSVEELKDNVLLREELRELLTAVYDIERLMSKIVYATAGGRDLAALKKSFEIFPYIKDLLKQFDTDLFREIQNAFDTLDDLAQLIDNAIADDPPIGIKEGGFIKDGFNSELDRLREIKNKGSAWLLDLEQREREQTGIKNLRIRYNKIFGYNIEITNSNKNNVPDRYTRRQTLANCERFQTPELKQVEEEILGADEKIFLLEYDIFNELRLKISEQAVRIQVSTSIIAAIDALQSFADVSYRNNYSKPVINDSGVIDIREGRHPVVELMTENIFVPNDTYLDCGETRAAIITGPNMAGKSTYMRQTALITLMAQIGCLIPADSGRIGIVDRIFTRVGASDDLATGQSTFMVEMTEVANILNNATAKSLLILDEIGRGTSTFDGLSIAWSVLEHISENIGAKTLFATHYHELTELEGRVAGIKNYCFTVSEDGEDIVFLRKIARGGANHSYGIHVARLAGVPKNVIERSKIILDALNKADITKKTDVSYMPDSTGQGSTYDADDIEYGKKKIKVPPKYRIILNEIQELDIDSLSPREALKTLYDIKNSILMTSKEPDDSE